MLFCGPTRVGKTALARATADFCFGAGQKGRLVRQDMSEYSGWGVAINERERHTPRKDRPFVVSKRPVGIRCGVQYQAESENREEITLAGAVTMRVFGESEMDLNVKFP
jgi:hypothetical protein